MNSDNFLLTIAIIAVLVSIIGLTITYNSISTFQNLLTGYTTESGIVTLEITSQASINITHAAGFEGNKTIDWGSGHHETPGQPALLVTNGTSTNSDGWATITEGFIIRNIGNVNVNLSVHSNQTAADMLGGSDPLFQYNLTNLDAGSCSEWNAGYTEGNYTHFTTSPAPVCNVFEYLDNDKLRMDILLLVPDDATIGRKTASVVLTYFETS